MWTAADEIAPSANDATVRIGPSLAEVVAARGGTSRDACEASRANAFVSGYVRSGDTGVMMDAGDRLTAEMASRAQLALRFIERYWAAHNYSPSYGEIAAGIGVNRDRARGAVRALERDGRVYRQRGRARCIVLPTRREAALAELRREGWHINNETLQLSPPTYSPLSVPAALDHISAVEGWGNDGADRDSGGSQGDAGDR